MGLTELRASGKGVRGRACLYQAGWKMWLNRREAGAWGLDGCQGEKLGLFLKEIGSTGWF